MVSTASAEMVGTSAAGSVAWVLSEGEDDGLCLLLLVFGILLHVDYQSHAMFVNVRMSHASLIKSSKKLKFTRTALLLIIIMTMVE